MIVDAHAHIASWPSEKKCVFNLKRSMEKYHISYALLSNCDCSEFLDNGKRNRNALSAIEGAKRVLRLVKKEPNRFGLALWVNPHYEKVNDELVSFIEENRKYIFAIKIHPYESRLKISDKRMAPYLELARRFELPLLFHTAADPYSDIALLSRLAKKNPDLCFVAAHLQLCSDNEIGIKMLKETPNLYADTAWVRMSIAKRVMKEIGPERIMFGTDNPIDGLDTLDNEMYRAYFKNEERLNKSQKERLFATNAINLYKLPLNIH